MDRHSRSISPRRQRNGKGMAMGGLSSGMGRRDYRRCSRSRSRSRNRSSERISRRRSRSHERNYRYNDSADRDLYHDIVGDDYDDRNYRRDRNDYDYDNEQDYRWAERSNRNRDYRGRDYDRDGRDRRYTNRQGSNSHRYSDRESEESDEDGMYNSHFYNTTPSNTIIVLGLQPHITEADIKSALIQLSLAPTSIRLIRKRHTGASRGFAFVEFNTTDEAAHWMELTQGLLMLQDQKRVQLQYSHSREQPVKLKQNVTDWYCSKCGVFNFKRRDSCFKCYASREESERGGEGNDEVSSILTKKIMLRNLDVLTNEESVLTAMQKHVPDLACRINKILVSRDTLTQISRGICYLHFESLVDSMNVHNALVGLEPPLTIDDREVIVTYCIDHENRQIVPKKINDVISAGAISSAVAAAAAAAAAGSMPSSTHYTLADVPRLAEYSATIYASTPAEHAHYLKYYTDYYIAEINKGQFGNLPDAQTAEASANSGAAVALSAIQRKQKKMQKIETTATQAANAAAAAAAAVKAAMAAKAVIVPNGTDGTKYPTPNISLYQYDETSGYYYDSSTGLYYDAHSQYYYNNETGSYLYWDQKNSTFTLASALASAPASEVVTEVAPIVSAAIIKLGYQDEDAKKKEKPEGTFKHDKVKVAKKIVKDMEKWAKQLNQKKDYTVVATPQPMQLAPTVSEDVPIRSHGYSVGTIGYADVGFSLLEKKEHAKFAEYKSHNTTNHVTSGGSDSEEEQRSISASSSATTTQSRAVNSEINEKEYVDLQKLTCLLCKRGFQSLDVLQKHLKMSNLHRENLLKYTSAQAEVEADNSAAALSYRDRAKERRLKYGESELPPPNRSRERFESEIKSMSAKKSDKPSQAMPISSSNVGNRLLQKMGWSEGQGLGRANQGRTNIIEAESRNSTAGLGSKAALPHSDDYKTYIKKMMKSRYESV